MVKRGVTDFLRAFEDAGTIFFDAETDLLVVLDECGNVSRVNPAFEKVLGYEESQILHQEIIRFIYLDDLASFIRSFDTALKPAAVRMLKRERGEVRVKLIAYRFKRTDAGLRGYLVLRPS